MRKIKIEIIETITKIVEVEAFSTSEAITLAKKLYQSEEIVLDSDEMVEVEFQEFTS